MLEGLKVYAREIAATVFFRSHSFACCLPECCFSAGLRPCGIAELHTAEKWIRERAGLKYQPSIQFQGRRRQIVAEPAEARRYRRANRRAHPAEAGLRCGNRAWPCQRQLRVALAGV